MSVKLPILRLVLSHCIVLIVFFQIGVFVSYDDGSLCDRDARVKSSSFGPSSIYDDTAATWWTRHRSTDGTLPPPFSVTRTTVDSMRYFLFGDKKDMRSRFLKEEEALVVRLSHHNESRRQSTTSIPKDSTFTDTLQECPTVKVLHHDFVDGTCLLAASYEESYHMYHYQLDASADGVYRPVTRIKNRHEFGDSSPMESFVWAQLFMTIQNNISSDLQQLLDQTQHPPPSTVLLLVVDKDTIHVVPRITSKMCPNEENPYEVLLWCLDTEAHHVAKQFSFPSYYNAKWSRTSLELLPDYSFLVANILAVQQLVLLKYDVVVVEVASLDEHNPRSLSIPRLMDRRATKVDIWWLLPSSQQHTETTASSMLESPMYIVKSTVSTKALWSKLALSLDLLTEEDSLSSLDEIISEYLSLFGMSLKASEMEKLMLGQTSVTCI